MRRICLDLMFRGFTPLTYIYRSGAELVHHSSSSGWKKLLISGTQKEEKKRERDRKRRKNRHEYISP